MIVYYSILLTVTVTSKPEQHNVTDNVVMLNTKTPTNLPVLLNANDGSIIFDGFNSTYGKGTEVYASCGTLFQDEFYIFGGLGTDNRRTIMRVSVTIYINNVVT